jgi:hypothetical protein
MTLYLQPLAQSGLMVTMALAIYGAPSHFSRLAYICQRPPLADDHDQAFAPPDAGVARTMKNRIYS